MSSLQDLIAQREALDKQIAETRKQEIADAVGRELAPRGLLLMGLDVIGGYLTEINVTSPTGFQEITRQANIDVAARFIDAVLNTR